MNLSDFIKENGRGSLAKQVETSASYLSQIAHGHRKASPALALAIEMATDGLVTRGEIRPDIYPPVCIGPHTHQRLDHDRRHGDRRKPGQDRETSE